MGLAMQLPQEHLLALHRGGYLHDMGKNLHPGFYSAQEGTVDGGRVDRDEDSHGEGRGHLPADQMPGACPCRLFASHHERWNGTGYPDGLAGDKIPLLARVLQFADIYDALVSERSYKAAMTSAEALRVMQEETERGWHDPELMRLFHRLRHDAVREAAEVNRESWHDAAVMRESLSNLRTSLF